MRRPAPLTYELFKAAQSRARRRGVAFNLTPDDVRTISEPMCCVYCARPLARVHGQGRGPKAQSPTLDRLWPSLGYVVGNVVLACGRCNRLKADGEPEEQIAVARAVIRERHRRSMALIEEDAA